MDTKQAKIKQFVSDKAMNSAVYEVILDTFLNDKKTAQEVNILAASRLAVTFLREAWKELERYATVDKDVDKSENSNVGL